MSRAFQCPSCKCEDRRKIQEVEDKSQTPLYFSMQGTPIYPKKLVCGKCGHSWSKST